MEGIVGYKFLPPSLCCDNLVTEGFEQHFIACKMLTESEMLQCHIRQYALQNSVVGKEGHP